MIKLAIQISDQLQSRGINVVLVGGLAVSCYTDHQYLTNDIDMVDTTYAKARTVHEAMAGIGFYKKGRYFISDDTDISVELPSAPLQVGDEIVQEYDILQTESGSLPILKASDIIKDRLSAYMHWNDFQSLAQALSIMHVHKFSPSEFEDFIVCEQGQNDFDTISMLFQTCEKQGLTNLSGIATVVEEYRVGIL